MLGPGLEPEGDIERHGLRPAGRAAVPATPQLHLARERHQPPRRPTVRLHGPATALARGGCRQGRLELGHEGPPQGGPDLGQSRAHGALQRADVGVVRREMHLHRDRTLHHEPLVTAADVRTNSVTDGAHLVAARPAQTLGCLRERARSLTLTVGQGTLSEVCGVHRFHRRRLGVVVSVAVLLVGSLPALVLAGTQGTTCGSSSDTSKVRLWENSIGDTGDNNDSNWLCSSDTDLSNNDHTLAGNCKAVGFDSLTWNDCVSSVTVYVPSGQCLDFFRDSGQGGNMNNTVQDGTLYPYSDGPGLAPLEAQDDVDTWLAENGYEQVQLGISATTAKGWVPVELAGWLATSLSLVAITAWLVSRRRPG